MKQYIQDGCSGDASIGSNVWLVDEFSSWYVCLTLRHSRSRNCTRTDQSDDSGTSDRKFDAANHILWDKLHTGIEYLEDGAV